MSTTGHGADLLASLGIGPRAQRQVAAMARDAALRLVHSAEQSNCGTCMGEGRIATVRTTSSGDARLEELCNTCGGSGRDFGKDDQ